MAVIARSPTRTPGRAAAGKSAPKATRAPARQPARTAAHRTSVEQRVLFVAVAGLSLAGLPMVLSASAVLSVLSGATAYSMFERQCVFMAAAVAVGLISSRLPLERLRRLTIPLFLVVALLLVAVLVPGVGHNAGGSSRWFSIGPIQLQPSELMKLGMIMFAADLLARRAHRTDHWHAVVRPLLVALVLAAGLIMKQPDLGTAIVISTVTFVLLFAAEVPLRILAATCGLGSAGAAAFALHATYRRDRLLSFLHPFAHASGTGYQVVQSLSTLGMGGVQGNGIGASAATWGFLPNAQTDFVFAVIGGNLGVYGSIAVILGFAAFAWAGLRIASREPDPFSRYLALGVTCWIVCQAVINVGGVIDALPVTGIPLPFISYGGSALIVEMAGVGLLFGIARRQAHAAVR
jgi:cell division protein FtsW